MRHCTPRYRPHETQTPSTSAGTRKQAGNKGKGRRSHSLAETPSALTPHASNTSTAALSLSLTTTSVLRVKHRVSVCPFTAVTLTPPAPARDEQQEPGRDGPVRRAPGRDHAGVLLLGTLHADNNTIQSSVPFSRSVARTKRRSAMSHFEHFVTHDECPKNATSPEHGGEGMT